MRPGRGITLLELLICVAAISLSIGMFSVIGRSEGSLLRPKKIAIEANLVIQSIRHAYTIAVMEGRITRMVFKKNPGKFEIETTENGRDFFKVSTHVFPEGLFIEIPESGKKLAGKPGEIDLITELSFITFSPQGQIDTPSIHVIDGRANERKTLRINRYTGKAYISNETVH